MYSNSYPQGQVDCGKYIDGEGREMDVTQQQSHSPSRKTRSGSLQDLHPECMHIRPGRSQIYDVYKYPTRKNWRRVMSDHFSFLLSCAAGAVPPFSLDLLIPLLPAFSR